MIILYEVSIIMELIGVWKGVLYIEKLRQFIEDEEFKIEFVMNDANKVRGIVTEEKQSKKLAERKKIEVESYKVCGNLNLAERRIRLSAESGIEIEADIDLEAGKIKGVYYKKNTPELIAVIELQK